MNRIPEETQWNRIRVISRAATIEVCEVEVADMICAAEYIQPPTSQGQRGVDEELDRVVKENRHLCKLSHPNLIKIFDLQVMYKEVKLVVLMELVQGRTLDNLIEKEGRQSEDVIRSYSKQICSALEYLHSKDIIHRNINSLTVMISEENQVKLIDFGLSIQLLEACSFQGSDTSRGLPQYMAPEVLEVTESSPRTVYSRGSDIWAFGCVVYAMAAGKKPYADCRNITTIARSIKEDPPLELPNDCSDALKSFYNGCMAKDRKSRKLAPELLNHKFLAVVQAPNI